MASFDKRTQRVTLDGVELFRLATFILNHLSVLDDELHSLESELDIGYSLSKRKAWITFSEVNMTNYKPPRLEFDIEDVFPEED
ncbi:MAG: hypothetical protein RLZZ342_376 [Candidatus Parcubacteria bacterium]|jgi:hypothetical protein